MKNLFWIVLIIGAIAGVLYWLKQKDTLRLAGGVLPFNGLRDKVISQYGLPDPEKYGRYTPLPL